MSIGLFEVGPGIDPDDQTLYLSFRYISGASGSASFSGRSTGDYEARLLFSDHYNLEDSVEFTVAGCDGNGVCDPGETCETCADCAGQTTGKPRRGKGKPIDTRFCCGNGIKEDPEEPPDFLICDGNF